mgnify:CR=1 FL=1
MTDGLSHAQFANPPCELEMAAGIGRDQNLCVGFPDMIELPLQEATARFKLLECKRAGHAAAPSRFLHLAEFDTGDRTYDLSRGRREPLAMSKVAGVVISHAHRQGSEIPGTDARFDEKFGNIPDLALEKRDPLMIGTPLKELAVFFQSAAAACAVGYDIIKVQGKKEVDVHASEEPSGFPISLGEVRGAATLDLSGRDDFETLL